MASYSWQTLSGTSFFTVTVSTEEVQQQTGIQIGEWATLFRAENAPSIPRVDRWERRFKAVPGKDFLPPMPNPFKSVGGVFSGYNGKVTLVGPALLARMLLGPGKMDKTEVAATISFSSPVFTGLTENEIEKVCVIYILHIL
jgi:hypothetical protein